MTSQQSRPHTEMEQYGRVSPRLPYWHFAALFIIICVLFVLRRPDSLTNPQFWAEDGVLLFQGQFMHGNIAWIFEPYRGYLIINTKLVAAFAALFPVVDSPLIYNMSAILIASLACSLFATTSYRHLVRSDSLRIIACFGAAGALYTESLVDNISNTQWYLSLIGFLLLFRTSNQSRWLSAAWAVIAGLAALTNPVLVIAAPICLWQLATKRNRSVASATLGGIVVQIVVFLFSASTSTAPQKFDFITLAGSLTIATVYKVVISSLFGWRTVLAISNSATNITFISIAVVIAMCLVWLFTGLNSAKRVQMMVVLYLIVASIALPMSGRGLAQGFRTATHITELRGEQYFFIASCAFLFLMSMAIERVFPPQWKYIQGVVFIVSIAGGFYENFRVPPFSDLKWPVHARAIEAWSSGKKGSFTPGVLVPLNPPNPPMWFIRLPAVFEDLTITGFPDHVQIIPINKKSGPIEVPPSSIRDDRDFEYVDVPLIFAFNAEYKVRVILQSDGPSVVSLLIHGRLNHGAWTETQPISAVDDTQLQTEVRTDSGGELCIHLRRVTGHHATFRSIIISHQER